ncbi:MAG: GTPase [Hyphomicrobiaceae bacterium]|nr:GTPase [Hyphomicrobiaceae bacterium]
MSAAPAEAIGTVVRAIEDEFAKSPPTLAVIGLSGVGKSSVINAMFGTRKKVSATTRGTIKFRSDTFRIVSDRVDGAPVTCALRVVDAPGLGEDVARDAGYLQSYIEQLPRVDIALWVVAARNRALALDQRYLETLSDVLPSLVLGVGQIDLVEPLDWSEAINMPSAAQEAHIAEILADRRERLGRIVGAELPAVAFSARRYYNLQALFNACLKCAPPRRRWMFEILKSFSTTDWLDRAKGLSAAQRQKLAERYITSDARIRLDDLDR